MYTKVIKNYLMHLVRKVQTASIFHPFLNREKKHYGSLSRKSKTCKQKHVSVFTAISLIKTRKTPSQGLLPVNFHFLCLLYLFQEWQYRLTICTRIFPSLQISQTQGIKFQLRWTNSSTTCTLYANCITTISRTIHTSKWSLKPRAITYWHPFTQGDRRDSFASLTTIKWKK